jgi:hypothetical protein
MEDSGFADWISNFSKTFGAAISLYLHIRLSAGNTANGVFFIEAVSILTRKTTRKISFK